MLPAIVPGSAPVVSLPSTFRTIGAMTLHSNRYAFENYMDISIASGIYSVITLHICTTNMVVKPFIAFSTNSKIGNLLAMVVKHVGLLCFV
jgi:hypothetical protein